MQDIYHEVSIYSVASGSSGTFPLSANATTLLSHIVLCVLGPVLYSSKCRSRACFQIGPLSGHLKYLVHSVLPIMSNMHEFGKYIAQSKSKFGAKEDGMHIIGQGTDLGYLPQAHERPTSPSPQIFTPHSCSKLDVVVWAGALC